MKWTVITGACGGLGKAFCQLCAEKKQNLFLCGTNETRLSELKQELLKSYEIEIQTYVCDFSDLSQTKALCSLIETMDCSLLINNAAMALYGPFSEMNVDDLIQMNQINMTSMMMLMHAALKNHGSVLNVSSTAAFQPGPMMAVYYATKAFVLSVSQAVNQEVKGSKVCALCCGPMETQLSRKAGFQYTWMQRMLMISPLRAAQTGLCALEKGKSFVIAGNMNRLVILLSHLLPQKMVLNFMSFVQSRRKA